MLRTIIKWLIFWRTGLKVDQPYPHMHPSIREKIIQDITVCIAQEQEDYEDVEPYDLSDLHQMPDLELFLEYRQICTIME